MEELRVGMVGLGVVGGGVAKILTESAERMTRRCGRAVTITKVAVRDPSKPRDVELPAGVVTADVAEVVDGDACDVVIELMGGTDAARDVVLRALASGKDVVTANKALLATHGAELFAAANEAERSIAFEASVAGGVPIVANLAQCLSGNQVTSLHGILNGTSNFILSKMHEEGSPYTEVVAEAQRLGYAEADPTMDVDGADAAQKLAILAQLAFGARLDWSKIPRSGIDGIDLLDIRYAQEMGYRIKLLAAADLRGGRIDCEVNPALVRAGSPLGEVGGPFNAILVKGDAVGPLFFYGQGAGQMPTASAVVADLVDTAVGRAAITFKTLALWSADQRVQQDDFAKSTGRRYVRLMVEDHPGVLADVTRAFGDEGISIAMMLQKEGLHEPSRGGGSLVPLVIMTHPASEAATDAACAKIAALPQCQAEPVKMWVRN